MNYLYSGSLSGMGRGGIPPGFAWGKSGGGGGGGGGGNHKSESHQNNMVTAVPIVLQREDTSTPWGFRLSGGNDYRLQLSVKQTQSGTPAHHHLHSGDVILTINGKNTRELSHSDASEVIRNSRTTLNLLVVKHHHSKSNGVIDRNSGI